MAGDRRQAVPPSVPTPLLLLALRELHEFILTARALSELQGELLLDDITALHDGLLLTQFPAGQHLEAQRWAKERVAQLRSRKSHIILNPKIDSGTQRRLQCSVGLQSLAEVAGQHGEYAVHTEQIGSVILPIIQASPRRTFKPRPA